MSLGKIFDLTAGVYFYFYNNDEDGRGGEMCCPSRCSRCRALQVRELVFTTEQYRTITAASHHSD